ncbi:MAG: hypothetical protein KY475_14495, partial [Planctomycetes bacterium]|nr:hypothetical protein [Planctomycetota bacterium]
MTGSRTSISALCLAFLLAASAALHAQGIDPASLHGTVIDDAAAEYTGDWKPSTHTKPFVGDGYRHDDNADKGNRSARFAAVLPANGEYHVLLAYTPGGSRATNVPVTIETADGEKSVTVNQRQAPKLRGFHDLGAFRFITDNRAAV